MNDEPATTFSRKRRREARKNALVWSVVVIALFVVAVMGAKFAYRGLKQWRADQFAAQAETFTRAEKWNDAAEKYRAALQLDPLNYNALRGAARLATRFGRP